MTASSFRSHAAELLKFCRERGYNDHVALLWDLARHSGRRRFAVWDFREGRAMHLFVAGHGSGCAASHVRSARARVSDEAGSHLSSVGHALVAERYVGRYGVAYRLDGLDETNASLRRRCVVLHGWRYTTRLPIWPAATVGSWGCPVLSVRDMAMLDAVLRQERHVVLWAYMQ